MAQGMRRCALAGALIAVLLAGDASAAKPAPVRCDKLTGKVLRKTTKIKVVQISKGTSKSVWACALPRGVARKVADLGDGSTLTIDKNAGTWFSFAFGAQEAFGHQGNVTLFNAATGKGHLLWYSTTDPKDPLDKQALDAYFFDAQGRAVTAQGQSHGPGNSSEQIYAYAPDGTGIELDEGTQDEIPGTSLAYDGRVITWTHSGQARTAAFVG